MKLTKVEPTPPLVILGYDVKRVHPETGFVGEIVVANPGEQTIYLQLGVGRTHDVESLSRELRSAAHDLEAEAANIASKVIGAEEGTAEVNDESSETPNE